MLSTPCIISIEDDFDVFRLIQLTLQPLGIELHHAPNGSRALEMTRHLKPDLLLLDLALPDTHGWDVLNKIRSTDNKRLKGVVVLSTHLEISPKKVAGERDVDVYMNKPFMPSELRNNVRSLLNLV